jgi:ATP-binding cassette subfamily B protein
LHERILERETTGPIQKLKGTYMPTTKQILGFFWSQAWNYKGYVISMFAWLPVVLLLHQIIPPIIAAGVLDKLSAGNYIQGDLWGSFGPELIFYSVCYLLGGTLAWRFYIYLVWTLEIKVSRDIMQKMFRHLSKLDMEFHNNSFGGSLVSRTNKLLGSYIRLADTLFFEIYGLLIMSIATGVILWPRSPQFVVGLFAVASIYIIVAILITRKIRYLSSIEAHKQNKVTGYLADMITNVMAVKSFSRKSLEYKRFDNATEETASASTKLKWAQLHRENIFAVSTTVMSILALVLATASVVVYDAEIGTVFLVLTYTANMTTRLWDFSQRTLRNINKSLGDAQEGIQTLLREPEIQDPESPLHISRKTGNINFDSVVFSHEDTILFNNFSLKINDGEKIGLVGHSGSGKTTLTKLLLRFKDIQGGRILINGVDVRETTQDELRSIMSYVPQEPLLFHRSLKENIAYGRPEASLEEIVTAAKQAHAHEFIEQLPQEYETLVGERGVKLSGGQKQRVAIARAMLKNAPILLLDEATSALDSESEKLIQDALWKLMEGKTAIVIAHRLSTIQKMDRIIVLDNGKIIEDGTHKNLIARKKGHYSKLWKHQSGGFLKD